MQNKKKQINVSITKIFNWPQNRNNYTFKLIFLPQDSQIPILQKLITGLFLSNSMNFNSPLKIAYTDDQKIVILQMLKLIKKDKFQLLGKFKIDLDALYHKNVQYFPFGKDYVLQINLYNSQISTTQISKFDGIYNHQYSVSNSRLQNDVMLFDHERYFLQREQFQKRSGYNGRGYRRYRHYPQYDQINGDNDEGQTKLSNHFSQKIHCLLQEVKQIKDQMLLGNSAVYQSSDVRNRGDIYENKVKLKKSMSDQKLKLCQVGKNKQSIESKKQQQKMNRPQQKYRLILKTLNIVPSNQCSDNQQKNNNVMTNNHTKSNLNLGNHKNWKNYQGN